jgi:alkylation response protein AidB-like acyl-CoA dehydrogenase
MDLDDFRPALDRWLDDNADALAPARSYHSLDEQMAQLSRVKRATFDAGWMRYGWPERVGGLGGSTLVRAYLGEALTGRDLVEPGIYSMTEVLAPTMIDYAPAELAATMVPRLLRGTRPGARASPSRERAATWPRCRAAPFEMRPAGG